MGKDIITLLVILLVVILLPIILVKTDKKR